MLESNSHLTKGSLLTKNIIFNFVGKLFPIVSGIVAIPPLVNNLGTERFGILTLIWLLIGYFSILDLGFSRAIINELGKDLKKSSKDISGTVSTITSTLLYFGIFLGFLVLVFSPILIKNVFSIQVELQAEIQLAFIIVSLGIPVTLISSSLRGVLETFQEFKKMAVLDSLTGGATYIGLAILSFFSIELILLVAFLVVIKISVMLFFYFESRSLVGGHIFTLRVNKDKAKSAFNFGKWIAVSNLINPIMGQMDRYMIGTLLTMSAVTFYSAPFDMIQKINLFPISIAAVLFPAFTLSSNSSEKTAKLFSKSILIVIIFVFPLVGVIVFFAEEILFVWLGNEFADQSTLVMQILVLGAFFNSLARINFTFIQGLGLPKLTAQVHLSEFIFYIPLLWILTSFFGIVGAAFSRFTRVFLDWIILLFLAQRKVKTRVYFYEVLVLVFSLGGIFFASTILISVTVKIISTVIFLIGYFNFVWWKYIDEETKTFITDKLINRRTV